MDTALINEFNLMQQSRSNLKYIELLEEHVYQPVQTANHYMTSWMGKRGQMLLKLDVSLYNSYRRLKKKYLRIG